MMKTFRKSVPTSLISRLSPHLVPGRRPDALRLVSLCFTRFCLIAARWEGSRVRSPSDLSRSGGKLETGILSLPPYASTHFSWESIERGIYAVIRCGESTLSALRWHCATVSTLSRPSYDPTASLDPLQTLESPRGYGQYPRVIWNHIRNHIGSSRVLLKTCLSHLLPR